METNGRILRAPLADIERALIEAYLRGRGFDKGRLTELSLRDREALLAEASMFASDRLAEIEARWHYLQEIHE